MTVDELVERTKEVFGRFPRKLTWQDLMLDMMEEMGELAQATLIHSGRKVTNDPAKQRDKEEVADAVCDVLYDLVLVADHFEVDLAVEYEKTLKQFEQRIEEGEFS